MAIELGKNMIQSIEDGNLDNVQKAIEKGALVNCVVKSYFCWTPLHYACAYGQLDIAKFLLNMEPNRLREDDGNHIIHKPCFWTFKCNTLVGRKLGSRWNHKLGYMTPLHYAAQMNRLEIVRYLLYGATIDAENENRVK